MNSKFVIGIVFVLSLFSCKKEEQSCSDGVFDPEKEEQVDCGGVCAPCQPTSTVNDTYLFAEFDSKLINFGDISLDKSTDWILRFQNDSIDVQMNFGDDDSIGKHPIKVINSKAIYNYESYSVLTEGKILFSKVDYSKKKLSGYFQAYFVSDNVSTDTLKVTGGQFENVSW